jgi:hypothetical protein
VTSSLPFSFFVFNDYIIPQKEEINNRRIVYLLKSEKYLLELLDIPCIRSVSDGFPQLLQLLMTDISSPPSNLFYAIENHAAMVLNDFYEGRDFCHVIPRIDSNFNESAIEGFNVYLLALEYRRDVKIC